MRRMKLCVRKWRSASMAAAVLAVSAVLTACGGVTEEQLEARTSAIAMMEAGDYEGAVTALNGLVEEATSVTEFELDILKYRAEAEFLLEDYAAAVHTYQTLMEVDAKKPEYCYLSAFALAYDGKLEEAEEMIRIGSEMDPKSEAAGLWEAKKALAEAYDSGGRSVEAREKYQELIDGGHGSTEIYNRLMMMAMDAGAYEEALKLAAKGMILTDGLALQELKFNEAVCYEYLGDFSKALELFRAYETEFGMDERVAHEITFLESR